MSDAVQVHHGVLIWRLKTLKARHKTPQGAALGASQTFNQRIRRTTLTTQCLSSSQCHLGSPTTLFLHVLTDLQPSRLHRASIQSLYWSHSILAGLTIAKSIEGLSDEPSRCLHAALQGPPAAAIGIFGTAGGGPSGFRHFR